MADSITLAALEPVADRYDLLAGYDDGHWPDAAAIASRFPGKLVLRITVDPTDDEGDVLDVETGDATPTDAPGWVARRRASGHGGPLVYMNASTWPAVVAAFGAAPEPGYLVAEYDGVAVVPPGAVGKQYRGTVAGPGGTYDESVVCDHLPGIDPDPVPKESTPMVTATTRTDTTGATMMLDVWRENPDGSVQHWWQPMSGPLAGKWAGPETLPGAVA